MIRAAIIAAALAAVAAPTSAQAQPARCQEDAQCWTWSTMGNQKRGVTLASGRTVVVGPCAFARADRARRIDWQTTARLRGDVIALDLGVDTSTPEGEMMAKAEREASKIEARLKKGRLSMLDDDPPFTPSEWRDLRAELEADLTSARAKSAEAKRVASALRAPSAALMEAVEAIRDAAASEAKDAVTLGAQRAAVERIFSRFEVITRPAAPDAVEVPREARVVALVRQQNEAAEAATADHPRFTFKGRGIAEREVFIVPIPRPEVAARFGGDAMDSLHELGQNVRNAGS